MKRKSKQKAHQQSSKTQEIVTTTQQKCKPCLIRVHVIDIVLSASTTAKTRLRGWTDSRSSSTNKYVVYE
ncbi:hypothetical protein M404DRAFT_1006389 [Pisolithus tinctorius Marx 270]|uniref:Uncharacterized protein n=1 Tax=Pisolithus tinctorius Marx 270 TaxID=870435 RepID=A0A0C3N7I1_PISTI|nr:hypothetical protein M404DRAFT_1006389 [Pisolithus tinctorius Marx 270]